MMADILKDDVFTVYDVSNDTLLFASSDALQAS